MCAGIPKGKSSNITSVDGFEGVEGLKVLVNIERCAKGEGGEGHEAQAEVVSYDEFVKYGSSEECKENGKLRVEGKDYIVKDGDVLYFRVNP